MEIKDKSATIKSTFCLKRFDVTELPTLLFFKNGAFVGKIEGYYSTDEKEEFFSKIKEIL